MKILDCVDDFNNFTYTNCSGNLPCGNGQCYNLSDFGVNNTIGFNISELCKNVTNATSSIGYHNVTFPSQDFWNNVVLRRTDNIGDIGELVWQLVVSLFVA